MFLVLFNRFDTFGESLKKPVTIIKKVPWEILKSGTRLEDQTQIKVLLNKVNMNTSPEIEHRGRANLAVASEKMSTFVARGVHFRRIKCAAASA